MPTESDPKTDIRPPDPEPTEPAPAAPRSGASDADDGALPLLPFGEDPGTIGVDDRSVE
jgi:hypothetical protein